MPNSSPTTFPKNILINLFIQLLASKNVLVEPTTLESKLKLATNKRKSAVRWLNEQLNAAQLVHPKYKENQGGFILEILRAEPGTWISLGTSDRTSKSRCKQIARWFVDILRPDPNAGILIHLVEESSRYCVQVTSQRKRQTGPIIGTLVASVHVSNLEFQDAAIKQLSIVGFEPFSNIGPAFAFYREFSSTDDLNQIVADLLSDSNDKGVGCELIYSLNVDLVPCVMTTFACIDACRMAGTKFIDSYHDALSNRAGYPILLVSAKLRNLISHYFSLEPVGELWATEPSFSTELSRRATDSNVADKPPKNAVLRSVIYRAWANVFGKNPHTDIATQIDEFLAKSRDAFRDRQFPMIQCENSRESELLGRGLLQRFREQPKSNQVILHWRCNPFRQQDLLRPFDESISDLAGLHRRSEFSRNGQKEEIALKINEIIDSFVAKYVDHSQIEVTRERIEAILVGSETPDVYQNVIASFQALFLNLLVEREIKIVVENFYDADELSVDLLNSLRNIASYGQKLQIYAIDSGKNSSTEPQLPELSSEVTDLLLIAAALGCEFRLRWLEEVWLQRKKLQSSNIDANELEVEFNRLIDHCLNAGILQFADGLIGGANRDTILIQMSWVHLDIYQYHRLSINLPFRKEVASLFWKWLQNEAGGPEVATDSVRLKRYVFLILQELHEDQRSDPYLARFMFQIGSQLTQRAIAARAHYEAHKRLEKTLSWFDDAAPINSPESKKMQALIREYLAMLEQWGEANEGQLSFLQPITDLAIRFSESPNDISDKEMFSLARTVWSYVFRRGNLPLSLKLACIADDAAHRSPKLHLHLEAYHILAVTLFAIGDLNRCQEVALKGYRYCEQHDSPFQSDVEHGTHDGRVCCKVFLALSKLLKNEQDASWYIEAALGFAELQKDANSKVVALSYGTLFYLLDNNLPKAIALTQIHSPPSASSRWEAFRSMMNIAVTACRENLDSLDDLNQSLIQLRETRKKWNFTELRAFWSLIEVTLLRRIGDNGNCQLELESAIDFATKNGDALFLPLLQHLRGIANSSPPRRFSNFSTLISKVYH